MSYLVIEIYNSKMKLDIDNKLSSFVGDGHKLKLRSRKNCIVVNYVCDRLLFLLSLLSSS